MIIVAIDPGMDGGISISANDPTLGYPVVNLNLTHDTLREYVIPGRLVVVEGVGTAGNHKLQQSFGEALGCCTASGLATPFETQSSLLPC